MSKLQRKDKELLKRIDEVLHYVWDPIGVSGEPNARDEYDSYVPHIFSLLIKNSSSEVIAAELTKITVDAMGLNENSRHDLKVADILISWMEAYKAGQDHFPRKRTIAWE